MKSTQTIFAMSSMRCIKKKSFNSSSGCSPEQVYFIKNFFYQVLEHTQKKKKTVFKFFFISGYAQMNHLDDFMCMTEYCVHFPFLFILYVFLFFLTFEFLFLEFNHFDDRGASDALFCNTSPAPSPPAIEIVTIVRRPWRGVSVLAV
ncbi:hypothetical protein FKM82_015558 [Ascaphus truei]